MEICKNKMLLRQVLSNSLFDSIILVT